MATSRPHTIGGVVNQLIPDVTISERGSVAVLVGVTLLQAVGVAMFVFSGI